MTVMKLNGPLGGDYQTDGVGNAVLLNSYPLTEDDDVPARLADHEGRVTAAENRAGRIRLVGYDDFANHPDGVIAGLEPTLGEPWKTTGSSIAAITSGCAHSPQTSGGYIYQTFDPSPTFIGAQISFGGSGTGWPFGLVFSADGSADGANLTRDLLHLVVGPTGYNLTTRKDGGSFPVVMTGTWEQACALDGTMYQIGLSFRGNVVTVYGPFGEVATARDPRISEAMASYDGTVFWQPIVASGTEGYLHRTYVFSDSGLGWSAVSDFLTNLAGAGWSASSSNRRVVGSKNMAGQVQIGRQAGGNLPAITFGATEIRGQLEAPMSISDTTFQSDQPIPSGCTVVIGSGDDAESLTTTGYSTGSSAPFTTTVTSGAAKAHTTGASVVATSSQFGSIVFNLSTGLLISDKDFWLQGKKLYLASDGSVVIDSSAANVAAMGAGDSFKVDGTYNGGHLLMGVYHLWIDGSGNLRIKSSAPSSATDGTVVGAQS